MKRFSKIILFFVFSITSYCSTTDFKNAIVKVYVTTSSYDYHSPWLSPHTQSSSGSGFVIDDKLIVTNAHVSSNTTFIQVQKAGDFSKYTAKVVKSSDECDLALLKVEDEEFYKDVRPLKVGSLPKVGQEVIVYGFPLGGLELSLTKGVVSRVEVTEYIHSGQNLLACQVDAAINPGNSGGPVLSDGYVVGVAFQGWFFTQNIGYIISTDVLTRFVEGFKKGKDIRIPYHGITVQEFENLSLRESLGADKKVTGVLVSNIALNSPAKDVLEIGDVITKINGIEIANNGTFSFRPGERTSLSHLVSKEYLGNILKLEVFRNKKLINKEIKLDKTLDDVKVIGNRIYDKAPSYYIKGGLVFQPLTRNLGGYKWWQFHDELVKYVLADPDKDKNIKEFVVLNKVLADEVNNGYHNLRYEIVETLNGQTINSIEQFVNLMDNFKGKFYEITTKNKLRIVLEREKADKSNSAILEKYGIEKDRSKDLSK